MGDGKTECKDDRLLLVPDSSKDQQNIEKMGISRLKYRDKNAGLFQGRRKKWSGKQG